MKGNEFRWALAHPLAALKVKKIGKKCDVIYNTGKFKEQLDSFISGGKADAFKHVFYMAAFSQKIRLKKIRKLGIAHEKMNFRQFLRHREEEGEAPDSLSSVMDLQNNETGMAIGCNYKNLTLSELENVVITEIRKGKAVIMRRSNSGIYLDCENRPVNLKTFSGKWYVPKCLVSSDFNY